MMEKVEVTLTPEHSAYLEKLRKSCKTNMWGAAPYVAREFGVDKRTASAILVAWMRSFQD